jgi:hypothetical protein
MPLSNRTCRWLTGLSLAALASLAGCSHDVMLPVWRPAEVTSPGMNTVAVLPFVGPPQAGEAATASLAGRLWENKFYALVDGSEAQNSLPGRTVAHVSGSGDLGPVVATGQRLGAQGAIVGEVVAWDCNDTVVEDAQFGFGGASVDGASAASFGFSYNEILRREATVAVSFRLIDVRSGEVKAVRTVSQSFSGAVRNGRGALPPPEEILQQLLAQCTEQMVAMIAPHVVTTKIELADSGWMGGHAHNEDGCEAAEKGDWLSAARHFQAAVSENDGNHAAWYNLGMAHAAVFNYPVALAALDKALELRDYSLYQRGKSLVQSEAEEYAAVQSQLQARFVSVGPSVQPAPAGPVSPMPAPPGAELLPPPPSAAGGSWLQ